mmetsp:Transcript_47650/g.113474  ORF Transcript_47650/g.113474 Transcript_47650/m.113474 type:complete len:204 (-) Transcript_47650:2790-3401(-)
MRLLLGVWIVLGILGETLRDHELVQWHLAVIHVLRLLTQELVHPLDGLFFVHIGIENLCEDRFSHLLGQTAPIPSHDVQAFELLLEELLFPVHNLESSIFLLLEKHETHKDCIDLDLQPAIPFIDRALDLLGNVHRLLEVSRLRVDEDGVCVTIHHLQLQFLLHDCRRALQSFSAFRRNERCQGLCMESTVLKTQAAIHGVCC